jgi:hypothetical protein
MQGGGPEMNTISTFNNFPGNTTTDTDEFPVFIEWQPDYVEKFGNKPFLLKHNLAQSAFAELPALERLAKAIHAARVEGRAVDAQLKVRRDREELTGMAAMSSWDAKTHLTVSKTGGDDEIAALFREFEDGRSSLSMMLSYSNEIDRQCDDILNRTVRQVAHQTGVSSSDITFKAMTFIISSPGAVTPYHNDYEHNFLLQIRGGKDVYLYDQSDSSIVSQDTIETFQMGDSHAAHYRVEFAGRESVYHLEPGLAVHHPALAPHWVKNGDAVSVSLSMYFSTRALDDLSHAHQANWLLRRLGFKPPMPNLARPADRLKASVLRSMSGKRDSESALFRGVERLKAPGRHLRDVWKAVRPRHRSAA